MKKELIRKYSVLFALCFCAGCNLPEPPKCVEGMYKCDPNEDSEGCSLFRCENDDWKHVKACDLGWNYDDYEEHEEGACLAQCTGHTYYCAERTDKEGCDLYQCEGEKWKFDKQC